MQETFTFGRGKVHPGAHVPLTVFAALSARGPQTTYVRTVWCVYLNAASQAHLWLLSQNFWG